MTDVFCSPNLLRMLPNNRDITQSPIKLGLKTLLETDLISGLKSSLKISVTFSGHKTSVLTYDNMNIAATILSGNIFLWDYLLKFRANKSLLKLTSEYFATCPFVEFFEQ